MGFGLTRYDRFFGVVLVVFAVSFVLVQYISVPSTQEVDSSYINGMLTATGILLGFLTVSMITGAKYLRQIYFVLIEGCFIFFILAVALIAVSEVRGSPTMSEYMVLQLALVFCCLVALTVVRRVSKVMQGL